MEFITKKLAENHLANGYADFIAPVRGSGQHLVEVRYRDGRPSRCFQLIVGSTNGGSGGRPPVHPFTRELKAAGLTLKQAATLLGVSTSYLGRVAADPNCGGADLLARAIAMKNGTAPPVETISCLE